MSEGEQRPIDSVPDPTAVSGSELGKSRATRRRILDAATACLAEQGYSRFSTGQVAARAGLTRPAMLYHFGSRQELLTAVMNHLTRRRIEMLDKALSNIAASEGHADRAYRSASLGVVWQQLETPEFAAYTELVVAARTDPELASVVAPALDAFDRHRQEISDRTLPPDLDDHRTVQVARDVVRFLGEGVTQQTSIVADGAERKAKLQHFLQMLIASKAGDSFMKAVREDWALSRPKPG